MLMEVHEGRLSALFPWIAEAEAGESEADVSGDTVQLSEKALRLFEESSFASMADGTYSLKSIDRRIAVVQAEIDLVWNSALPWDEKNRQVQAKENEIALLQAGQFTFLKSRISRMV
ncbi:hypothetical protein [Pseudodesulfovibrio tunisiensis]|uniref:hypothetical protein n=1 Tax=Pseudodesulfovibrio tunisiensis TaxID=463192 RepID=UPI001FB32291|nr:hypothetical protein [Pseudodesulfovibrio tunisiensis]